MTTISEFLHEFDTRLGDRAEPELLTLTEGRGFVPQRERFKKRLATENTSNYKVVSTNDIAYNQYLLWAGAIAQNTSEKPGIASQHILPLRDGFDPRYVMRLLSTQNMRLRFDSISFGAVPRRRRAKVEDFLTLEIPDIPPLSEQKHSRHPGQGRRTPDQAHGGHCRARLAQQSVFLDMFGDPVTNSKGWDVGVVGDCLESAAYE